MAVDRGDALLFTVASRRDVSWSAYRGALDSLFSPDDGQDGGSIRYVRWDVARVVEALAHWDIVAGGDGVRICVAPPVLATLPWPGLPRAVLCGSRSPDTVAAVAAACASVGKRRISMTVAAQAAADLYAPTRLELEGDSDGAIREVAAVLGIDHLAEPSAWALAVSSCSIGDYLSTLEWTDNPEVNWPRSDFDPDRLQFGPARSSPAASEIRLSTYEHPAGWARLDRMWRDGRSAVVDRAWGRYAVLAAAGIRVLRYDLEAGTVSVPRQLRLPKVLARSLALCSGWAPLSVASTPPAPGRARGTHHHVYADVPADVFEAVATKLGQDLGA